MQEEELAEVSPQKVVVRKAAAAGTMYPADPAALARRLSELFAATKGVKLAQPPLVVIAPHSEMGRSGEVAASAINHLVGHQYDTVVVIAPSHSGFFPGAAIYDGAYQTPLGDIAVDSELVDELTALNPHIKKSSLGHTGGDYAAEFSLEAVLPHLQLALGTFSLVPIITGDQEVTTARALGDCLHSCLKKRNVLIVVSTDLSHYHDKQKCAQLDSRTRKTILALDAEGLINLFLAKQVEACGMVGLIAAMFFARRIGIDEAQELAYTQSEVSQDEAIGHCGIVITRSAMRTQFIPSREQDDTVSGETLTEVREYLQKIARGAILSEESILGKDSIESGKNAPRDARAKHQLLKTLGVFVSIYQQDKLVGRAGYLRSSNSLAETVAEVSRAAFIDSTQTPDTIDESALEKYQVIIHILSPLRREKRFGAIDLSIQGVMVKLEMNSAYMFPDELSQACNTPEPAIEEALGAICLKAKLPRRAYADSNAEVYVFDIESF